MDTKIAYLENHAFLKIFMMFFAYNNGEHYIPFVKYAYNIHNIITIQLSFAIETILCGMVIEKMQKKQKKNGEINKDPIERFYYNYHIISLNFSNISNSQYSHIYK
tara:strand:- start:1807 stop:2124 length:318 start_codon:yes stop_codon:yes gene_type:complete